MERKKILLIEDEVKLARFVELELKYEGYDVTTCHDGRVGMETVSYTHLQRSYPLRKPLPQAYPLRTAALPHILLFSSAAPVVLHPYACLTSAA